MKQSFLGALIVALAMSCVQQGGAGDPVAGPTMKVPARSWLHVLGEIRLENDLGAKQRTNDCVISGLKGTAEFQSIVSDYKYTDNKVRWLSGASLESGYAYVKMDDPNKAIAPEIAAFVIQEPLQYRDLLVDALLESELIEDARANALRQSINDLENSKERDELIDFLERGLTPDSHPLADAIDDAQEFDIDVLWQPIERGDAEPTDVANLILGLMGQDDPSIEHVKTLFGYFKYPFLLGRRTVGGAEGTEIVVYVRPRGNDGADVHYFYVAGKANSTIDVGGFRKQGNAEQAFTKKVKLGEYAHLSLKLETINNKDVWIVVNGTVTTGAITPTVNGVPAQHIIASAYRDACDAGIGPTSPITVAGAALSCP